MAAIAQNPAENNKEIGEILLKVSHALLLGVFSICFKCTGLEQF
jgi:hypothetical protein